MRNRGAGNPQRDSFDDSKKPQPAGVPDNLAVLSVLNRMGWKIERCGIPHLAKNARYGAPLFVAGTEFQRSALVDGLWLNRGGERGHGIKTNRLRLRAPAKDRFECVAHQ